MYLYFATTAVANRQAERFRQAHASRLLSKAGIHVARRLIQLEVTIEAQIKREPNWAVRTNVLQAAPNAFAFDLRHISGRERGSLRDRRCGWQRWAPVNPIIMPDCSYHPESTDCHHGG